MSLLQEKEIHESVIEELRQKIHALQNTKYECEKLIAKTISKLENLDKQSIVKQQRSKKSKQLTVDLQCRLDTVSLNCKERLKDMERNMKQTAQEHHELKVIMESEVELPSLPNIKSEEPLNPYSLEDCVEPGPNATTTTDFKTSMSDCVEPGKNATITSLPGNSRLALVQDNNDSRPQDPVLVLFKAICRTDSSKRSMSFSSSLNKLFVHMNVGIAFDFKLEPFIAGVIVRTTVIQQTRLGVVEPVVRCYEHSRKEHTLNEGFPFPHHFIRCSSTSTWYEEDPISGFLSVCAPLSDGCAPLIYRFMCRTSCVGRRVITMRFELMLKNVVLATDLLDVRVCACPCRDRMKEENVKPSLQFRNPKRKCPEVFKVMSPVTADVGRCFASFINSTKRRTFLSDEL